MNCNAFATPRGTHRSPPAEASARSTNQFGGTRISRHSLPKRPLPTWLVPSRSATAVSEPLVARQVGRELANRDAVPERCVGMMHLIEPPRVRVPPQSHVVRSGQSSVDLSWLRPVWRTGQFRCPRRRPAAAPGLRRTSRSQDFRTASECSLSQQGESSLVAFIEGRTAFLPWKIVAYFHPGCFRSDHKVHFSLPVGIGVESAKPETQHRRVCLVEFVDR